MQCYFSIELKRFLKKNIRISNLGKAAPLSDLSTSMSQRFGRPLRVGKNYNSGLKENAIVIHARKSLGKFNFKILLKSSSKKF